MPAKMPQFSMHATASIYESVVAILLSIASIFDVVAELILFGVAYVYKFFR